MASKSPDDDKNDPSLELPSLSLPTLRSRKKAKEAREEPKDNSADDTASQPTVEAPVPAPHSREKPVASVEPAVKAEPSEQAEPSAEPEPSVQAEPDAEPGGRDVAGKGFALPALSGGLAATVTGAVVGVVGTVLTLLSLAGCEAIKGTSTCGSPGFFLLVAILVVMILVGMVLLRAWQLSDPGSTSFLAVGIVAVIALVMLIEVIFSAWMFVIIPIVSAGAYALSEWVTTRFVQDESPGIGPDVR